MCWKCKHKPIRVLAWHIIFLPSCLYSSPTAFPDKRNLKSRAGQHAPCWSVYLQLKPPNPCHLTMQKWTEKVRHVQDRTLSSANTFRNRYKLSPVVVSQLPISSTTAGKAGGTWELVTAAWQASTASTSTNQSSERPVLIWATAVGPSRVYTKTEAIQPSSLPIPLELRSLPVCSLSIE